MTGRIKNSLSMLKYRLKIRNALQAESIECLRITLEESKREIERRNKK